MPNEVEKVEEMDEMNDQHGSAMPDGFESDMYKALNKSVVEEVSEETGDNAEEIDTEESVKETDEDSADKASDSSEEPEQKEEVVAKEEPVVRPEASIEPQRKPDSVVRKEREPIKFDLDPDLVDPQIIAALNKTAETLNEQQKSIDEENARLQAERDRMNDARIDSCFDIYEKDLPRLGNTSKLTEDSGQFRREIYAYANVAMNLRGLSLEEAIKDTVQMFKNKDGEKAVAKNLITKLNKQKETFTNPPTRKKTSNMSRKFSNPEDEARFVMDEAYKVANIN